MILTRSFARLLTVFILVSVSFSTLPVSQAWGSETFEVILVLEIPEPSIEYLNDAAEITIDGWGSTSTTGSDILPERTFYIPIDSEDVPEISEIDTTGYNSVESILEVEKVPSPSAGHLTITTKNSEEGSSIIKELGTILVEGDTYWMLRISPFCIADGNLVYPDSIYITVELENEPSSGSATIPEDLSDPTVDEIVTSTPLWEVPMLDASVSSPGAVYHNTIPDTECLIITSTALNSSLQPLASWKTSRGVYTRIVETSWIYSNFAGSDNQAKIRSCVRSFYTNENLKWVILGGDHSVVPSRMAYVPDGYGDTGSDGSTVPADAYYGDIAGSGHTPYDWDGDNDGNYGEYSVDGIDLSCEVYVGRLSATSSSAMTSLVNNILNYEKSPPSGNWFKRTVLAGAYSNYLTTTNSPTDEAKLKEEIRKDFFDGGNYVNYTLYEGAGIAPSSYPKNASLSTTNLISAINTGASVVNLAGHGSNTGIYRRIWSSDSNSNGYCDSGEYYDTAYYSTSASQTNGGKKPLFYNDACNNGNFDSTWCLTEDIVRDVGIGAVGAGRVSWYAVGWSPGSDGGYYNQGHDYRFWEQYAGGAYQPGKALALSHSDYISDKTAHNVQVWKNLLQYNLIGDPEIPIYNATPKQFTVTYSDPIPTPGPHTFTVKDGSGNAVKDAMVCLMNGSVFYATAMTDSAGKATINMPSLTMMVDMTITARNFKPFIKSVAVGTDSTPPQFGMSYFSGNTTTGDGFEIGQLVTDNVEVTNVTIRYGRGMTQPTTWTNESMAAGTTAWTFASSHPEDSLEPFWYSIGAKDRAGNWAHTTWIQRVITDNDKPEFVMDMTSFTVTTGDSMILKCTLDDNIAVGLCNVNISIDNGPWQEIALTGTGNDKQVINIIPSDAKDAIRYRFNFSDTTGNYNESDEFYRTIVDNDEPFLVSDNTVLPARTGNTTLFDIEAGDNIEIASAHLLYMFGMSTEINLTMTSVDNENFTRGVDIPSDYLGNIYFHYVLIDTTGNAHHTGVLGTTVVDDDNPVLESMNMNYQMTTGDPYRTILTASDNIALQVVSADVVFPDGTEETILLSFNSTGDTWDLDLVPPSDITGDVNITFTITDTSGNYITTETFVVPLRDNDLPVFLEDQSYGECVSGEEISFEVSVEDNVGIMEVRLFAPDIFEGNRTMGRPTRADIYALTVDIPLDLAGEISYHFKVTDLSGNSILTEAFNSTVNDMTSPVGSFLGFVPEADPSAGMVTELTTGESFISIINVVENIGLDVEEFHYRIGEGTLHTLNLTSDVYFGPDNRTCTIEMPVNETGTVHFRYKFVDTYENILISEWQNINLVDNDAPRIIDYHGNIRINTSDGIQIAFTVDDNIGITSHRVWLEGYPDAVIETDIGPYSKLIQGSLVLDENFNGTTAMLYLNITDGNNTCQKGFLLDIWDGTRPTVTFTDIPEEMLLSEIYHLTAEMHDNVGLMDPEILWSRHVNVIAPTIPIGYTWVNDNIVDATLIPPGSGEWEIHFRVPDLSGNIFETSFFINVIDDIDPVPDIDLGDGSISIGETLTLNASSTEDDSGIDSYEWTITLPDGTDRTFEGEELDYVPEMEGSHNIRLKVTDAYGNTASDSINIMVTPTSSDDDDDTDDDDTDDDDTDDDNDTDDDGSGEADDLLLYGIIIGSVILLLIVLLVIFLVLRRRKNVDDWVEEDDDDEEEEMTWD